MNQYYLMSQLPSLDGLGDAAVLPVTEETFEEVCSRFLEGKPLETLRSLSLTPPREAEPTGSPLVDAWNARERALRIALGTVRAGNMHKAFDTSGEVMNGQLLQTARNAMEQPDPLAAERYLNDDRMNFLESIRPLDGFCDDAVYYYGLKLKLMQRMRLFDREKGQEAYRNIYDSILHGDDRENEK